MSSETIQEIQSKLDTLLLGNSHILQRLQDMDNIVKQDPEIEAESKSYTPESQLTKNFKLRDLIRSKRAILKGINNMPSNEGVESLIRLCENILQPVRDHYGVPILPNSGYRSPALNESTPNASKTSQHMKCQAVDFEVPGISNFALAKWIRPRLDFDQLILEFYDGEDPHSGWVHCSYVSKEKNRRMVMTTSDGVKYIPGLIY